MNIFKRMFYSMYDSKKYGEMIQASMLKTVLYGIFISGLSISLVFGASYLAFRTTYGTIGQVVENSVPEFELKNKSLHVERPVLYNEDSTYINVDTGEPGAFDGLSLDRIREMSKDYFNMIIADKERAVILNAGSLSLYEFQHLPDDIVYTKQDILEMLPLIKIILFIFFIVISILLILSYFVILLFFSFTEMLLSGIFGMKYRFSTVFKVAIHASTPVCVFLLISTLFGFHTVVVDWIMIILLFVNMQRALRQIYFEREEELCLSEEMLQRLNEEQKEGWKREEKNHSNYEQLLKQYQEAEHKISKNVENQTGLHEDAIGMEEVQEDKTSDYIRHQPDVIHPSSGWSFGNDEETKE